MQSDLPKVLHTLSERPLVWHVLDQAVLAGITSIIIIVSYQKEKVIASCNEWQAQNSHIKLSYADQGEPKGTGHAVLAAEPYMGEKDGSMMVLLGDVPAIKAETLKELQVLFTASEASAMVTTTKLHDATGYGRIVRKNDGAVQKIVEQKDATPEELKIQEINTGIFVFNSRDLWPALKSITPHNAQGEYYLTDIVEVLISNKKKVVAQCFEDSAQFRGVNSPDELKQVASSMSGTKLSVAAGPL